MVASEASINSVEHEATFAKIHRHGDSMMLGLLGMHFAFALCFAAFYDTWFEAWTIGGLGFGMFAVAKALQPGTYFTRCTAGVALQVFVALHIYQLHGLAEMHFFFFTSLTAMIVYKDWRCMWPGTALIIAQHVLFATLHNQGVQTLFFEGDYVGVTKLVFHFGIAILHALLCGKWARLLRARTLAGIAARNEIAAAERKAALASAAKTAFLGNMSHELRTPMAGVIGMTDLLLRGDLSPEAREGLRLVRSSAQAMVDIVNDCLDLSRVEAGKLQLARAPFDLRRITKEVLELAQPRAREARVTLALDYAPEASDRFVGDGGRLRQIVTNLVGNAIKFAPGGNVRIAVAVTPGSRDDMRCVRIEVADDGIGIAPDALQRLFERFEQGSSEVFASHGGSGLGLAICRELAELMAAKIDVKSTQGQGSTFTLTLELPTHSEREGSAARVPGAATPRERLGLRVLLVEDDLVCTHVTKKMLLALGCEVTHAGDGAAAVELQAARRFDVILMDCRMPRMDGNEATQRIRSEEALGARTPILALSANSLPTDRAAAEAAGADGFLTKPVTLARLREALEEQTTKAIP